MSKSRLSPCALGVAFGLVKGLWLMLLAWSAYFGWFGMSMVNQIAVYHSGYSASIFGGLVGGAYGFGCGFIFGLVLAFFYNFCLRFCCKGEGECK